MPGNPREIITAERRFPVRIRIGVPPEGLVQEITQRTGADDRNHQPGVLHLKRANESARSFLKSQGLQWPFKNPSDTAITASRYCAIGFWVLR
jgi:hypothetical protein